MSTVHELYEKLGELLKEAPEVGELEMGACGVPGMLRVFRDDPDGKVVGLSLEDESYMAPYIEEAKEIVEELNCGTLSQKHMEYLVELSAQEVAPEEMYNFVKKYAESERDTVMLKMHHPFDESFSPARETVFTVLKSDLENYLDQAEDCRTAKEFFETYDSKEADIIYGYMADDGKVLSEEITYSDTFEKDYADYIKRTQMFNPGMSAEQIATKEDYYWAAYVQLHDPSWRKTGIEHYTTMQEALEFAKDVRKNLKDFNNVYDEVNLNLYSFVCNGEAMNVFASVRMEKDENHKWFAVYSGVEFDGGDTVYADYDHSTDTLQVTELAKALKTVSNYYKSEEHLKELEENPVFKEACGKESSSLAEQIRDAKKVKQEKQRDNERVSGWDDLER